MRRHGIKLSQTVLYILVPGGIELTAYRWAVLSPSIACERQ